MERLCVLIGKEDLPKSEDLQEFIDGDDGPEVGDFLNALESII